MDVSKQNKRNIQPFQGERYATWKFRISALLEELDVAVVVAQEVPAVPTEEWKKKNSLARNTIIEYLGDSLLGFAKEQEFAKQIIANLDTIYERRSLATQLTLRKKLLNLKTKPNENLQVHFTRFDDLVTELLAAGAKLDEMDKISHLLLTLPSVYDGVITALETLSEDNLNLAFVKTRLLDYEIKSRTDELTVKALETIGHSPPKNDYKKTRGRRYNPAPKQNKQYLSSKTKGRRTSYKKQSEIRCFHCGRNNHIQKDCFYYKRMIEAPKSAQQTTQAKAHATTSSFAFMMGHHMNNTTLGREEKFIIDSGATDHICNNLSLFESCTDLSTPVQIAVAKLGTSVTATKRGTIKVITTKGMEGQLEDVLYAPDVQHNLISVRRIQAKGMTVIFSPQGVTIKNGKQTILTGKPFNGLLAVTLQINKSMVNYGSQVHVINNYQIWHERLGHISKTNFNKLKAHNMVEDINHIDQIKPTDELCEACIYGKQARLPFNKNKIKNHVTRPLFNVHTDVCGPVTPPTINSKNYFVTFIDEFTHYTVTYLITFKGEVKDVFQDYLLKANAHFNLKIVNLYCDNGREYLSNELKDLCAQKGITYHLTVPYTPQQNGIAERMNRTITEKARAMLVASKLASSFWGEAVLTATYLINRSPTKALINNKTPYEMWYQRKPTLKYLKVFGSTVYIHIKTSKNKFDKKSNKGILVGYEPNGYRVWKETEQKFIIARDVVVDEANCEATRQKLNEREYVNVGDSKHSDSRDQLETQQAEQKIPNLVPTSEKESERSELRRSERHKNRPITNYDESKLDELYNSILSTVHHQIKIPKSVKEIAEREDKIKWEQAIKEELDSLEENKTWTLVKRPMNANIVDCKWVFTLKNDEQGNISRYKARLVAKGFSQKYLEDYDEIFAPVARLTSFRCLLAFANQFDLLIHHMDVKTAFLNGILKETIYMKVPEQVKAREGLVCKLNKAIYGLKQASRCWYERFDELLKSKGFINSQVEHCIYLLDNGDISNNIYVLLYVDDVIIVTKDALRMLNFKKFLMKNFKMTDLRKIKLFLGIRIERNNDTLTLDQSIYLKAILDKFNMTECKPVKTPINMKIDYEKLNSEEDSGTPCRQLIGSLMYVCNVMHKTRSLCHN
jgi:transposase InsO family protein